MKTKNKNFKKLEFVKLDDFEEVKQVIDKGFVEKKETGSSHLFVKTPFRNYLKGDLITNKEEVKKILDSHESSMVLKTNNK